MINIPRRPHHHKLHLIPTSTQNHKLQIKNYYYLIILLIYFQALYPYEHNLNYLNKLNLIKYQIKTILYIN